MCWVAGILTCAAIGFVVSHEYNPTKVFNGAIFVILFIIAYAISKSRTWTLIIASVPAIAFGLWDEYNFAERERKLDEEFSHRK